MLPISDDNPTKRFPVVTLLLIVANLAVFFAWQLRVGLPKSVALAGLIPTELHPISPAGVVHVFTSMFMSGLKGRGTEAYASPATTHDGPIGLASDEKTLALRRREGDIRRRRPLWCRTGHRQPQSRAYQQAAREPVPQLPT